MTITSADYRDILNLVYVINSCQDVDSFVDALFPAIIKIFRSECATFQLIRGYPHQVRIIESRAFKSDSHNLNEDKYYPELYKKGYFHQSPLLKEAISSSKTILKIGESISLKEWERSDLYNGFILPQHLYWELFLTLRWKNNLEGMITLWRSRRQSEYGNGDTSKAEILAPHIMLGMRNVNTISKINSWKKRFLLASEAGNEGLLLLDQKLRPTYSNAKAREICRNICHGMLAYESNPGDGDFPIPSHIVKDCSDMLDLLRVKEQTFLYPKERILFTENNEKFRIECSLVWKTNQISSVPNFMVTLNDLNDDNNLATGLQSRFHLSRRELEIISYMIAGLSYGEIADKMYISKLTVHTHIKNVYRKLGAKSRFELYRYLQSPTWLA